MITPSRLEHEVSAHLCSSELCVSVFGGGVGEVGGGAVSKKVTFPGTLHPILRKLHQMAPQICPERPNVHIHVKTTLGSQISLPFTLRVAISKIIAIFHFPIAHKDKFKFLEKNRKLAKKL